MNYHRLAVCEKALAEYLETKRLSFPRFYFVSASDLLAILSKGNEPTEVSTIKHKCNIVQQLYLTPFHSPGCSSSCKVV